MPAKLCRLPLVAIGAALLLAGCQSKTSPDNASGSGEEDKSGLPVHPGIYGNVQPTGGMELQIYGPPRDMLEVTLCKGPCTSINRARYVVDGDALAFSAREPGARADTEAHQFRLTQQGDDVRVESSWTGNEPVVLKRLPERTALADAQEAMLKGAR